MEDLTNTELWSIEKSRPDDVIVKRLAKALRKAKNWPTLTETRPVCDCCDREVDTVGSNMWTKGAMLCAECKYVWRDEDLTDSEQIKARVLEKVATGWSAKA